MSWLSSLLGMDAQHNAGVAQNKANAYGDQAAGLYGGIGQQGQNQTNTYNQNYLPMLQQFSGLAGLGRQGFSPQSGPGVPTGPNAIPGDAANQKQGGPQDTNNPYSLDQNQQALLNQQTASLTRQYQSSVSSFQQQMQAHGISDPRALEVGQQTLQEHYAALKSQTETQFYEQIKQDKLSALQALIGEMGQYGQQGISEQEFSAGGIAGLAGAQQNQSNIQQQDAQTQQAGLLHLLTQFFPGGTLSGNKQPASTPPITFGPTTSSSL